VTAELVGTYLNDLNGPVWTWLVGEPARQRYLVAIDPRHLLEVTDIVDAKAVMERQLGRPP